jgi:hypothetical protein
MAVIVLAGVGMMPSLLPPSNAATINNAAIDAIGSIPLPPPLSTTAIATINNCHCCCHTVNNDNRQKPAVVVCHQCWQWQSLLMEVVVDGSSGNVGLC